MFLRRTPFFKNICTEYRSKANTKNPGIQKRLKIFRNENPEVESLNLNESQLEDNECDFFGASHTHLQHEKENTKLKKLIEFKRIERKFFSPIKHPNLLTWSEKEQIKYLFNSDPSTWTPEKLALSFPATIDTIKKVLKSQWAPKNQERIKEHDEKVSKNWEAIEKGEIKLPSAYESHIKQFISRRDSSNISNTGKAISLRKQICYNSTQPSEFINIITSYKNKKVPENSFSPAEKNTEATQQTNSESGILSNSQYVPKKHKYYTLEELRSETEDFLEKNCDNSDSSELDKHFVKSKSEAGKKESGPIDTNLKMGIPIVQKFQTNKNGVGIRLHQDDHNEVLKINIPLEKKKKGGIYKVKDCYYDENGEFLYKVPGMT